MLAEVRSDLDDRASLDGVGLPAWTYRSSRFLDLERRAVFRTAPQLVCHLSDIPEPGDYQTLDILGEHVAVLRDRDGEVRAFHNVCRHRAARLLDGPGGRCAHRIVCPYHAWSYDLDGRLRAIPRRQDFGALDMEAHGLKPAPMRSSPASSSSASPLACPAWPR